MTREAWIWCGVAVLGLLWCGLAAATGGGLVLPFIAASLGGVCAVNAGARDRVSRVLTWTFSGSALRSGLIIVGALMLIQLLPLEMALLLAGDVLAYVELLAALGVIAANTRLRPLVAAARLRIEARLAPVRRPQARPRTARAVRPRRKAAPADDADGRAWAFA